ncbi:MAG: ABC transporter ATP-binding protein [Planctomycetota bacterium]|jgi:putative ABC transport system ATP-binding protein|nr:ABC transporter ATP-binding protein [Planctomycetota bacterium]
MSLLEAEGLGKSYPGVRGGRIIAVDGVDLKAGKGEMIGIVGRSGSGKTTLLALFAGLLRPTSGRALVAGVDVHGLEEGEMAEFRNRNLGFVPQGPSLIAALSVRDNVRLPHFLSPRPGEEVSGRADELLERLGLAELRDRFPAELSGGEMRRVSLARSLINRPALVLADEPTGDLDSANSAAVMEIFEEAREAGTTVVFSTHETWASARADRLFRMAGGKLTPLPAGGGER